MSRASWSSTGSDAEVRHHFDQPFDYDPRRHLERQEQPSYDDDDDDDDDEVRQDDAGTSDDSLDVESLDDSLHSLDDVEPQDAPVGQDDPQPSYLDDTEDQANQAICRICLESASSDASRGESLGRLLSPCRCKGTMKYVHATCLDQWRAASARSSSAVACDQCGAPYRFRKSKYVGLATSPTLLFIVSLFLFLTLIWTVGLVATFFMDVYDRPYPEPSHSSAQNTKSRSWWPWRGSALDPDFDPVEADAWSYLDADYSPGIWSYGTLMYEPAAYVKLIKEAVRSFASGEAADAVREVVGLQDTVDVPPAIRSDPEPQRGFWSALKYEWMYGDGGLWEKKAAAPLSSPAAQSVEDVDAGASNSRSVGPGSTAPPKSKPRERYDARAASDANDLNAKRRRHRKAKKAARRSQVTGAEPQGWLNKLFIQFSVGFSLVGILSFVNILVGASFIGPINLHNFGLGRSFARMTSGGRGRNGNQEGVNIASILIVLLVIIGVVRALLVVYKLVRKSARRGLSRLEAVIVDWNYEGDTDTATGDTVSATQGTLDQNAHLLRQRHGFVPAADD